MESPPQRPAWLTDDVWPFELRYLRLSGQRIAVTDVGSGPTLLFCHAGMWSLVWRDVMVELSSRYRCVTFDPPGSGLSERAGTEGRTLAAVRDTITHLMSALDLQGLTLVLHDLGGPAALAAAAAEPDRIAGLVAVNTFGWRPTGLLFRTMLAVFGSACMRELDARTGWLPAASSTRFGVGKRLDRPSRRAFRHGMDPDARRTMHLLFRSARSSDDVYSAAAAAVEALSDQPALTVFGALGDYLRFRPQWRRRFTRLEEASVPRGLHFPMCDDPSMTAAAIDGWYRRNLGKAVALDDAATR